MSQFKHQHKLEDKEVVYTSLKYLKSTPSKEIMFKKNGNLKIEPYNDADWGRNRYDRKSTTSYFIVVGVNIIT